MTAVRPGARLFLLFFALYALTSSGNPFRVPDEFEVYFQTENLVDAGDISVPQTLAIRDAGQPIFFGEFGRDGRPYAPYGPGVAFLLAPFHAAGRGVARLAGVPRAPLPGGIPWELVVGGITSLGMAFAAALAVAGCARACLAVGTDGRHATVLAALLGGATILWPYGTALYSEAWLAAAFAWTAVLLLEARAGRRPLPRVAAAALLLVVAGLTKPTALVIAPGFVIAALVDRRVSVPVRVRVAAALAAGIAIAAAAQIAWNVARFGRPLDFGYNLGAMIPYPPARSFAPEDVPWGLFVQLLTPGKSIFVWAPVTLVTLLSWQECWRRDRAIAAGLAFSTVSALVFYAAFLFPEGGYSHGPRHLVPLVPLMMLPLAVPGVPRLPRALAVCAVAGAIVAALAVSVSFLEDQSPTGPRARSPYYDTIDPSPGRPSTRYRTDYVPFKYALTSGRWASPARPAGNGPDFFALHLVQARRTLPDGDAIPPWLPWAVSLPWVVILVLAAASLRRPRA
jgi:hypothetical protein